ncbi:hypothetical protein NDU88_003210 [Pleurodeles waltl]|uniref:Uncharacterized protein n=1 Tax=Pleurodeles waltl TaxID=8319 RepID=A0AAV7MQZ5_PLEWA|nr:hypothetical protein NDU88_003210 [Pleurodeles waltl]
MADYLLWLYIKPWEVGGNHIRSYLELLIIPVVSWEDRFDLLAAITQDEVVAAISRLTKRKASGGDVFPSKHFYQTYSGLLVDRLFEEYLEAYQVGALPITMKEATIAMIPKADKDPEEQDCYRSLSVLKVDMKVLSRVFAPRYCLGWGHWYVRTKVA